jgi:hypothetical protein
VAGAVAAAARVAGAPAVEKGVGVTAAAARAAGAPAVGLKGVGATEAEATVSGIRVQDVTAAERRAEQAPRAEAVEAGLTVVVVATAALPAAAAEVASQPNASSWRRPARRYGG